MTVSAVRQPSNPVRSHTLLAPFSSSSSSSTTSQKHDEHLGEPFLLFSSFPFYIPCSFPRTCLRGLHISCMHQLVSGYIQTTHLLSQLFYLDTEFCKRRNRPGLLPWRPAGTGSLYSEGLPIILFEFVVSMAFLLCGLPCSRPCHVPRVRMTCDSISLSLFLSSSSLPLLQGRPPSFYSLLWVALFYFLPSYVPPGIIPAAG